MGLTGILGAGLIAFFTQVPGIGDDMAFWLAFLLVAASFGIAVRYRSKYHRPLAEAIDARVAVLDRITGGPDADLDEARLKFAASFNDIDAAMQDKPHPEVGSLRRTWEEYRETIVDPNAEVLHNTARPEFFFVNLGEGHRGLNWFANIFIALGLLITFMGIIAALSTLDFSGGAEAMQGRLNELMKVAGAKFWASVGGIVASIVLRAYDYRFAKRINDGLADLCDRLEHGMAYLPPQRIASDQLAQLREQTPALRAFSEQMAAAFDGALEKQMAPMIAHLGSIQQGIDSINGSGGDAVRDALTAHAGAEMSGLAEAIGAMTHSLAIMSENMERQTGEADRQIEEAVRRFGQASEEMRGAFGELNRNFEVVAERMRADSEQAGEQARERMGELLNSLGTTLDSMKDGLANAAEQMGRSSADAAGNAARIGQQAMEQSFAHFVDRFNETGTPLVAAMRDVGGAMAGSAEQIGTAGRAIGDHARNIEQVAARSADLAGALGDAAGSLQAATDPVRQSAAAIAQGAAALERAVAQNADGSEAAREEVRQMAAALKDTAASAGNAWAEYRARFAEVDRSLGDALEKLTDAAGNHAANLNERVGQIDKQLGEGVAQLAGALQPLADLREAVDDLAQIMDRPREAAE